MSHEFEERKRAERARARQQMGTLFRPKQQALVAYCVCGAKVETVAEVVLCEHGKKREA